MLNQCWRSRFETRLCCELVRGPSLWGLSERCDDRHARLTRCRQDVCWIGRFVSNELHSQRELYKIETRSQRPE